MAIQGRPGGGIRLVLNQPNITRMFEEGGMVFRYAAAFGREVQERAEVNLITAGGVKTGDLLTSLGHSTTPLPGRKVNTQVRAGARHALWYHDGTRPHEIHSRHTIVVERNGKLFARLGVMRFFWDRIASFNTQGGDFVFFSRVSHPGWKGNPFLANALRTVMRRKTRARL
jgi:hypothetical protein